MVENKHSDWDTYLLGIDTPDERAQLRESTSESDGFARVERSTREALAHWCADVVALDGAGAEVRLGTRKRLLATLTSPGRFQPFFADLGTLFGLADDALRTLLNKVDEPASYQTAPMPGVQFFHFAPGGDCGFAEAGIVKLAKGMRFPRHEHLGAEINFVLEGTLVDAGVRHGPGSAVAKGTGSAHDYCAGQERDLILVAGHNGIRYLTEQMASR
jgi:ChrR Cupin-like domain